MGWGGPKEGHDKDERFLNRGELRALPEHMYQSFNNRGRVESVIEEKMGRAGISSVVVGSGYSSKDANNPATGSEEGRKKNKDKKKTEKDKKKKDKKKGKKNKDKKKKGKKEKDKKDKKGGKKKRKNIEA